MTTSKVALVDSNVLVYAALNAAEHFRAAQALRQRALTGEIELCVTPQILAEFFAIVTDPRRVTVAHSRDEALQEIEKYLTAPGFVTIGISTEALARWVELTRHHPIQAQEIFDVLIVSTMLSHGIHTIYTFNKNDFEKFEEIKVIVPQ